MKVKKLIKCLKEFNQEAEILIGNDEELNVVYGKIGISPYEDDDEDLSKYSKAELTKMIESYKPKEVDPKKCEQVIMFGLNN